MTIMSSRTIAPMSAGQCHQLLLGGRRCTIRWRTFGAEFQLNGMVKVVQFPSDPDGDEQEQNKSALGMALAKRIVGLRCVGSRAYLHQASCGESKSMTGTMRHRQFGSCPGNPLSPDRESIIGGDLKLYIRPSMRTCNGLGCWEPEVCNHSNFCSPS